MDYEALVVMISVPSQEVGEQLAEALLEQKLAACVNFIPGIRSHYFWKGEVQRDEEWLLLVKTRGELFHSRIVPTVKAHHPYEVPEIIALPIVMGAGDYLEWIRETTDQGE